MGLPQPTSEDTAPTLSSVKSLQISEIATASLQSGDEGGCF